MLLSLAIAAVLLTATMVAIDASFQAYSTATAQASTQVATRMVAHRLLTLLRTSTAHGPLLASGDLTWPVTLNGTTLTSDFIELLDTDGDIVRIEYRDDTNELWYIENPDDVDPDEQPLLVGVTAVDFTSNRRLDGTGTWVLDRATVDITVVPGADNSLTLENATVTPIRVIASTTPRKLD